MRYLITILIVNLFLGPVVWAQPSIDFWPLPEGRIVETDDERYKAYTLEEFKTIIRIYTDYKIWGSQISFLQDQVDELVRLSVIKDNQLDLRLKEIEIYKRERDLLTEKYLKENKLRHECENRPNFGSWLAWGSAAVLGTIAIVVTGILISKEYTK